MCLKDHLFQIAEHLGLTVKRNVVKEELKAQVNDQLVKRGVLKLPVESELAVSDGTMAHMGFTQELEGESQAAGALGGQDEEGAQRETPGTLPRFDALSTASDGSRDEARLKVRIARLEIEANP